MDPSAQKATQNQPDLPCREGHSAEEAAQSDLGANTTEAQRRERLGMKERSLLSMRAELFSLLQRTHGRIEMAWGP